MKMNFKQVVQPAFTLIELVITIVVIGILSAALVATYSDVSGSAKKAAQEASLSALQSQIAIHLGANLSLPTMYQLTQEIANLNIVTSPRADGTYVFEAGSAANPFYLLPFSDAQCLKPIFDPGNLRAAAADMANNAGNQVACVRLPRVGEFPDASLATNSEGAAFMKDTSGTSSMAAPVDKNTSGI